MVRPRTPVELGRGSVPTTGKRRKKAISVTQQQDLDAKRASESAFSAISELQGDSAVGNTLVRVTFAAPATDTPVHHGIKGKVSYVLAGSSAAMTLYDGVDPSGEYQSGVLWLRSTASGTATIMVQR